MVDNDPLPLKRLEDNALALFNETEAMSLLSFFVIEIFVLTSISICFQESKQGLLGSS